MLPESDFQAVLCKAQQQVAKVLRLRSEQVPSGLWPNQRLLVEGVLRCLTDRPGIVVAERTGQGKTQIALATIAAMVSAMPPGSTFTVLVLVPKVQVADHWVTLTRKALSYLRDEGPDVTYVWGRMPNDFTFEAIRAGKVVIPAYKNLAPRLRIVITHYESGITPGLARADGINDPPVQRAIKKLFGDKATNRSADLLIVDEAHLFRDPTTDKYQALETLFAGKRAIITARRTLFLTATPFQLTPEIEFEQLRSMLSWPVAVGAPKFPDSVPKTKADARRLFQPYLDSLRSWLHLALTGNRAKRRHAECVGRLVFVQEALKWLIIRSERDPVHGPVQVRYGHPDPNRARTGFHPEKTEHGVTFTTPLERLLFLAWDGAIATRTTFIATEQQTLASSVAAACDAVANRKRTFSSQDDDRRGRNPLRRHYDALCNNIVLASDEHGKVKATVEAIRSRLFMGTNGRRRPTVVFVERRATLNRIQELLTSDNPNMHERVATIDGNTPTDRRIEILKRFNGVRRPFIDALIATKVAGLGLDIDGGSSKEDIWLIHHDLAWNPAEVEQRNGRVYRPAKESSTAPVYLTYPYLRDTIDERIFSHLFRRHAESQILLGCCTLERIAGIVPHQHLEECHDLDPALEADLAAAIPDLRPNRGREDCDGTQLPTSPGTVA